MARPAPFPHRYTVSLADRRLRAPPRAEIAVGAPPQFGGRDDVWSPEELLVGAALECLWTTFEAYANHDGLQVRDWQGSAEGILNKGPTGPVFTSISLAVELEVASADLDRARALLDKAESHCIVSKALNVPVTVAATLRSPAA